MNQNNKTISVLLIAILSLFVFFSFAAAENLEKIGLNNSVHPSQIRGSSFNNSMLNGTFIVNLTVLGANVTSSMPANMTNGTISFYQTTNLNVYNFTTLAPNYSNVDGHNGHTFVNITINSATIPDGVYNITIYLSNTTGTMTVNHSHLAMNITVDNFAPAINYLSSSVANNTALLTTTAGLFINVTINDTSPVNVTVTWANSTNVNTTTFIRYFCANGCINNTASADGRNFNINLSLMEHDNEELITYNVTVLDQWGRSNTSLTRQIARDGAVPGLPSIGSTLGNSIETDQSTTMSCTVTEEFPSLLSLVQGATTICSSSTNSCSASYSTTEDGDKTFTCTMTDRAGNTRSNTYTLSVEDTNGGSSGSSGGGSGGGGGGGAASSSVAIAPVSAGESTTVEVDNSQAGVESVSFTAGSSVSGARVTVTPRSATEVSSTPQHSVYKYFEVNTQNLDDSQITEAKIEFTVSESWLTGQGKSAADVTLLRLQNGQWMEYSARLLNVENGNMHFESTVPGFSTFAIALKGTTTSTGGAVTGETPTATPQTATQETTQPSKRRTGLWVGLFLVVIAGAVLYLVMQKKKR